jgi:hypothetical protein
MLDDAGPLSAIADRPLSDVELQGPKILTWLAVQERRQLCGEATRVALWPGP